jgi:hypothetical protein
VVTVVILTACTVILLGKTGLSLIGRSLASQKGLTFLLPQALYHCTRMMESRSCMLESNRWNSEAVAACFYVAVVLFRERKRIMFITHLKPLQPKTAITDDLVW